ncbi:glycosyltransferase family 2 protein [Altericista sp. CCNU0014]|uniref:glycosyltransferase family 2 protein n=1 Tax=Altericista sp. CCNU0014 TaxID=3082949 RepID=UPI00384BFD6F
MFCSIVIPTYNRKPILEKCLRALERQTYRGDYEVVVVDDGSTDDTIPWLRHQAAAFPHVRLLLQNHLGPAAARNLGVEQAAGDTIVFIDSDLVVTETFLQSHADALIQAQKVLGHDRLFTYGAVINTSNFDCPTAESYKLTDFSAAYFATGNVTIPKHWLIQAGLFDPQFSLYGWEDLELGVRLKQLGLKLVKVPEAVGYHWHPAFGLEQLPALIDRELQRGKMGAVFYQKHPTWDVRIMLQMTALHWLLWGGLSLGGRLNERSLRPLMEWLIRRGQPGIAYQVARIFLNWYSLQGLRQAMHLQGSASH